MTTIAILSPGDMGHGVGQALIAEGHRTVTSLDGRSDHSRALAARAGIEDLGSLEAAVTSADVILSIVPPQHAVTQGQAIGAIMDRTGARPAYVDCNAVSPMTVARVAEAIPGAFIDCGIIGLNPIKTPPTRFYLSGPDCSAMEALASDTMKIETISAEIGKASALKMTYAALTKGGSAMQIALLMTAREMGVYDALVGEFEYSQKGPLTAMRTRLAKIPADAERWAPEMEEIAATFAAAGVTSKFHEGAADIYHLLARTPFASETRETLDESRTLEQALDEYLLHRKSNEAG